MEGDTGVTDNGGGAPKTILSPPQQSSSWRLNIDRFRLPEPSNSSSTDRFSGFRGLFRPFPSNINLYLFIHIKKYHTRQYMINACH
ncbi:hypothetical protein Hanom_Chr03g00248251 [Helianthus anomalus]